MSSYAHVVHTTAKQVISRRRKNENVYKMSKDEICTCKACKNTVFHCQICKFVGFLLPSSSWMLKLPIVKTRLSYRPLLKNTIILFVCLPTLLINTVSIFCRDSQWSQDKINAMLMQIFGGQTKNIKVYKAKAWI